MTCEYAPSRGRRSSSQVLASQQSQPDLQIETVHPQLGQQDMPIPEYRAPQVHYQEAPADWVLHMSPQPDMVEAAGEQPQTLTRDIEREPAHPDIQISAQLPTPTTFDHGKKLIASSLSLPLLTSIMVKTQSSCLWDRHSSKVTKSWALMSSLSLTF